MVVGGGYALSALAVTGLAHLLTTIGLPAVDATALAQILGFLVMLALVIAGFAIRNMHRLLLPYLAVPAVGWLALNGLAG